MSLKKFYYIIVCFFFLSATGCDFLYRLLHKEGAEEKELLGDAEDSESNGPAVEVQKLLKLYGYRVGTTDGKIGPNTRNAILAFQKDNGLKESRFVDKVTWQRLHMFEDCGLVANGELSIMGIQKALKAAGMDPGAIDGKMGRKTDETVKAFQQREGLKPDGKVGFKTLKRLAGYLSPI